jgi:FtsH-binding integral membrane protein
MPNLMNTYQSATTSPKAISASRFMSKVYLWMMAGLAISAATAFYIFSHPILFNKIIHTPGLFMGLIIAQLAAVVVISWLNQRISATLAMGLYLIYTLLTGTTLSVILFAYTQQAIFNAFAVTAGAFFGLSVFGYVTKRDLGPIGTFCMMGLFGMIAIILLSFFIPSLHSSTMQLTISAIGVLVFSGLTAYDTQRIKMFYLQNNGLEGNQATKAAINGALTLYLDFINLFLSLLRLFSRR